MWDVEIFCTDLVVVKLAGAYVKFCREFLRDLWKEIAIVSSEEFLKKKSDCDIPHRHNSTQLLCVTYRRASLYSDTSANEWPPANEFFG